MAKKGVVYRVPCKDSYVRKTGRNLWKRLVEHRSAVGRVDENNSIAAHAKKRQHQVNWEGAEVLLQEPRYWKRS